MSLAVLARKSKAKNPRFNNNKGCFNLNMTNRGILRSCINNSINCNNNKLCDISYRKPVSSNQSSYANYQRRLKNPKLYSKNSQNKCSNGLNFVKRSFNNDCLKKKTFNNNKSSDIILKNKNCALNSNYKEIQKKIQNNEIITTCNKKGQQTYTIKNNICPKCYCKNNRILGRIHANEISIIVDNNKVKKSLSDLENLKNPQSDYLEKLKANVENNFICSYCKLDKNKNKTICKK